MTYKDIPGYCDFHDFYRWVFDQLPTFDAQVVEVGCFLGHSVAYMATLVRDAGNMANIVAVDTFEGSDEHKRKGVTISINTVRENLKRCGVDEHVMCIEGMSVEVAKTWEDERFDFVFIDAAHDYKSVKADIEAWWPKVTPGGILAGHDYCKSWLDVMTAVDEIFPNRNLTSKSVWWIRKQEQTS